MKPVFGIRAAVHEYENVIVRLLHASQSSEEVVIHVLGAADQPVPDEEAADTYLCHALAHLIRRPFAVLRREANGMIGSGRHGLLAGVYG